MKKILLFGVVLACGMAFMPTSHALVKNVRCNIDGSGFEDGTGNSCNLFWNARSVRSRKVYVPNQKLVTLKPIENRNTTYLRSKFEFAVPDRFLNGERHGTPSEFTYYIPRGRKVNWLREDRAVRNKERFASTTFEDHTWGLY